MEATDMNIRQIAAETNELKFKMKSLQDTIAAMQFELSTSNLTEEKAASARERARTALVGIAMLVKDIETTSNRIDEVGKEFNRVIVSIGHLAGSVK